MRSMLHVAALPFPSPQGTQAAVRAIVGAGARAGQDVALVCYGDAAGRDGARGDAALPFPVLRAPRPPGMPSLRSGPSLRKLASDAGLAWALRRAVDARRPDAIVAHHVEAAAVATALPRRARPPVVFVAHTSLADELPFYGGPRRATAIAGKLLDAGLMRAADRTLAVSPALAARLPGTASHLPIPWPVADVQVGDPDARDAARRRLGLPRDAALLLYAGNLDGYQGWEDAVDAVAALALRRPHVGLVVATASDPAPLRARAWRLGLRARLHVLPLDDEPARLDAHLVADAALVPRRAPGGLPVKLLDALARGLPVVAQPRALAGLDLADAVAVAARDDDPAALAAAAAGALDGPDANRARVAAGHRWLRERATDAACLAALDAG